MTCLVCYLQTHILTTKSCLGWPSTTRRIWRQRWSFTTTRFRYIGLLASIWFGLSDLAQTGMQLWDALRKWEDTTADWEFQVSTRDILPRKPNVRVSKFNRGFTGFSQCEIQVFSTLNPEDMEKEIQAALKVSAIHIYFYLSSRKFIYIFISFVMAGGISDVQQKGRPCCPAIQGASHSSSWRGYLY